LETIAWKGGGNVAVQQRLFYGRAAWIAEVKTWWWQGLRFIQQARRTQEILRDRMGRPSRRGERRWRSAKQTEDDKEDQEVYRRRVEDGRRRRTQTSRENEGEDDPQQAWRRRGRSRVAAYAKKAYAEKQISGLAAGTQKTYLIAGSTPSVTASSNMEIAEGSKAMSLACCCASSANWVWPGDT